MKLQKETIKSFIPSEVLNKLLQINKFTNKQLVPRKKYQEYSQILSQYGQFIKNWHSMSQIDLMSEKMKKTIRRQSGLIDKIKRIELKTILYNEEENKIGQGIPNKVGFYRKELLRLKSKEEAPKSSSSVSVPFGRTMSSMSSLSKFSLNRSSSINCIKNNKLRPQPLSSTSFLYSTASSQISNQPQSQTRVRPITCHRGVKLEGGISKQIIQRHFTSFKKSIEPLKNKH